LFDRIAECANIRCQFLAARSVSHFTIFPHVEHNYRPSVQLHYVLVWQYHLVTGWMDRV